MTQDPDSGLLALTHLNPLHWNDEQFARFDSAAANIAAMDLTPRQRAMLEHARYWISRGCCPQSIPTEDERINAAAEVLVGMSHAPADSNVTMPALSLRLMLQSTWDAATSAALTQSVRVQS